MPIPSIPKSSVSVNFPICLVSCRSLRSWCYQGSGVDVDVDVQPVEVF